MKKEDIKALALTLGFSLKPQSDGSMDLNPYVYQFAMALLAAAPTPPAGTPSAQWRENGETDPHGERYQCERAELCMGNLTDDELANAVFLHGNEAPDIAAVLRGETHMPLSYLTAAKDRIRWLSRKLEGFSSETPPAPEVEPLLFISMDAKGSLNTRFNSTFRLGEKEIALYTRPANDGLRRAAEDAFEVLDGVRTDYIDVKNNLRAELNKDKSC